MAYDDLGPRFATGTIDPNVNSGNHVIAFTPQIINSRLPEIECYHIEISGPTGSTFQVLRNSDKWGSSAQGWINEWDPQQPLPLRSGDTLYFYWSTNTTAPTATIWLRTQPY